MNNAIMYDYYSPASLSSSQSEKLTVDQEKKSVDNKLKKLMADRGIDVNETNSEIGVGKFHSSSGTDDGSVHELDIVKAKKKLVLKKSPTIRGSSFSKNSSPGVRSKSIRESTVKLKR
jgi:hypothetical protein